MDGTGNPMLRTRALFGVRSYLSSTAFLAGLLGVSGCNALLGIDDPELALAGGGGKPVTGSEATLGGGGGLGGGSAGLGALGGTSPKAGASNGGAIGGNSGNGSGGKGGSSAGGAGLGAGGAVTGGGAPIRGGAGAAGGGGTGGTDAGGTGGANSGSTGGATAGGAGGTDTGAAGAAGTGTGGTDMGTAGAGGTGTGGTSTAGTSTGGSSPCGTNTPCSPVGGYACSGSTLQVCQTDAVGCAVLSTVQVCGSDLPLCNATTQRCECDLAAAASCTGPNAQRVCSSGQWTNVACPAATPACVAGVCTVCTEHSQCPGGACHLSGPKKGTCFESQYVYHAPTSSDMINALNALSAPGELAILLAPTSFTTSAQVIVKANQEVAIIGDGGRPTWGGYIYVRTPLLYVSTSGILYTANLRMEDATSASTAIGGQSGSILWVDDCYVSGFYAAVETAATETHIRRSFLRAGTANTLGLLAGTLFMDNTVVGPLLTSPSTATGGIMMSANSIVLDIRYSTIVGGQHAIYCNAAPQPSGSIRNSILLDHTTEDGPLPPECNTINQTGNYAPATYYTQSWFVDPTNGDFRLSAGGMVAVLQTAQWQTGDPPLDMDGTARPQSTVGYPGVDQP
jgi:hypothetical protein